MASKRVFTLSHPEYEHDPQKYQKIAAAQLWHEWARQQGYDVPGTVGYARNPDGSLRRMHPRRIGSLKFDDKGRPLDPLGNPINEDIGLTYYNGGLFVTDPNKLQAAINKWEQHWQQFRDGERNVAPGLSGGTGSGGTSPGGGGSSGGSTGNRRSSGYEANPPEVFDAAEYLRRLYEQQKEAQRKAIENQLAGQVDALNRQKIGIQPLYDTERRIVDAAAIQAGRRLAEILAARGQSGGGQNITANVALQAQRGQALADVNRRETTELSQIEQRIADLKAASARDIAAMEAALAADRTRALLEDKYRQDDINRSEYWQRLQWNYGLERDRTADERYRDEQAYRRWRDSISDERYRDETEWQRRWQEDERDWERRWMEQERAWEQSPDNPAYRAQILGNMLRELQLQNYGEQQNLALQEAALQLERLKQQLAGGRIDNQTAEVQLEMLREQLKQLREGIPARSTSSDNTSTSGSTVDWDLVDRYAKRIDEMYPPVTGDSLFDDDIAELQRQRIENIKAYLRNLRASGVPDEVIIELLRLYNIPLITVGESLGENVGRVND